jgi:tRNA (guanine9-N1)-methyltransferase
MNENGQLEPQVNHIEPLDTKDVVARKRPSKTLKKHLRYMKKLEYYRNKKQEQKLLKRNKKEEPAIDDHTGKDDVTITTRVNKQSRFVRQSIRAKLKNVYENEEIKAKSLKVIIDCSFCAMMSEKEQSRLAQQIGQCYASNKAAASPAYFKMVNLKTDTFFYKELFRVNDGFERYIIEQSDQSLQESCSTQLNDLVYLTPDAKNILQDLQQDKKTYVLGGLVDETVSKKATYDKCESLSITSARLPIEEFMTRHKNNPKFNYSKVLSINQVFDILLTYSHSNDWKAALSSGVPKRKGYFIEKDENDSNNRETVQNVDQSK